MKKFLVIVITVLLIRDCASQGIKVKSLFRLNIYEKNCKVLTPRQFANDKYYHFYENMYSFDDTDWCAVKVNSNKMILPNREILDYKIINDSVAVFLYNNLLNVLFYCNYKTGKFIRSDTIIKNQDYELKGQKFKLNKYSFLGGVFSFNKFYCISVEYNQHERHSILRYNLDNQKSDTLVTSFVFDNLTANIKSNEKLIVVQDGSDISAFNLYENSIISISKKYPETFSSIYLRYKILDFIDNTSIVLYNIHEPHKFALLNFKSGKCAFFELDKKIFNIDIIRQEDDFSDIIDRPVKKTFKYLACERGYGKLLLSFADRQNYRNLFLISFTNEFINKVR